VASTAVQNATIYQDRNQQNAKQKTTPHLKEDYAMGSRIALMAKMKNTALRVMVIDRGSAVIKNSAFEQSNDVTAGPTVTMALMSRDVLKLAAIN
jgi:hypothetical protein